MRPPRIPVVSLLVAIVAVASLAPAPHVTGAPDRDGDHEPDVEVLLHRRIPVRDGVELTATIWKPAAPAGPLPAVLVMTPYVSDETHERAVRFAKHGYVYVSVDVRGRGGSDGQFTPLKHNGPDGADVIAWLARQPWSDGRVAMRGGSYRGMVQWQVMAEDPPALVAAVPTASAYPGEDFPAPHRIYLAYDAQWLAFVSGDTRNINLFSDSEYWRSRFRDHYLAHRPFHELAPLAGANADVFLEWLDHHAADEYWTSVNPDPEDYAALDLPILTITGYFDGDQPGAMRYVRELEEHGPAAARERHLLLIGPWNHAGTRNPSAEVGGLSFPENAVIDVDALHLAYLDWVLKDGDRPELLADRVTYYVPGDGVDEWRHAPSLEALSDGSLKLYLTSEDNPARDPFHSGRLTEDPPGSQEPDVFVSDPRTTPETDFDARAARNYLIHPGAAFGDERLVYHGRALESAVTLAGPPRFTGSFSVDSPDVDVAVEVDAVLPDGTVVVLGQDKVRGRFRRDPARAVPIEPGVVEPWIFDGFYFNVRRLPAGSRLRLVVGPVNSPGLEKNYNSGGRLGYETLEDARVATVRLHLDPDTPSFLELPTASEPGSADAER